MMPAVDTKRILVICAHDDDEVIGPGGTIRKFANSKMDVTTVIFASGNQGYRHLGEKNEIVNIRKKEQKAASDILGTKTCIIHDYDDFSNLDCRDVYIKVINAVRKVRPHLVFSHLPTDYLAHRTLAKLVPEAIWQAGWQCSLEEGEPWQVDRLYLFPILELIPKPSHIIDISETFEAKLRAMKAYESQLSVVSGITDQIEAKARAYGSLVGVKYGEAFMRSQAIPIRIDHADSLVDSLV